MRGFVIAHGRSGTTWVAHALRECCGLDARHESMGHALGTGFGGVEVNGNLWRDVPAIRERFPAARVIHQVRDGRKVVRAAMSRKPGRTVERACRTWAARNLRLMQDIPAEDRYRLEDLVSDRAVFAVLAVKVGAWVFDMAQWEVERHQPKNANPAHRVPPFDEWSAADQETFWRICGPTMAACGYEEAP